MDFILKTGKSAKQAITPVASWVVSVMEARSFSVLISNQPLPLASHRKQLHATAKISLLKFMDVTIKGRHDPVIVPRAVVVVEAMAALTITDALFANMTSRLDYIQKFYTK